MNGLCKTCRWWGVWYGREHLETVAGPDGVEVPRVHKPCACPKVVDASDIGELNEQALPPDAAAYADTEGYKAHLFTGPEFGCVHWESAEKPA
jgi:hypothetical protein